jgi:hypothetical protein
MKKSCIKKRRRSMQIMNASVIFCGLDIHRNGMTPAAVVDQMGELVQSKRVPDGSVLKFLDFYHPTKVAMEASTATAPIHGKLKRQGYDDDVSHLLKTRANRRIKDKNRPRRFQEYSQIY